MRTVRRSRYAAVLGYMFLAACSGMGDIPERVDVELVSIEKSAKSSNEQSFSLVLRLTNLSDQPLEFTGVVCDLELEGFRLVRGVQGQVPRLEPYSAAEVSLQASISLVNSIRLFNALAVQDKQQFRYVLHTRLDRASFWEPAWRLEQEGTIDLRNY